MKEYTDVAIIGAGMAGLTLAIQLKNANPDISITLFEKRKKDAPISTHKVGESTVELGTHYLREVIGLKDYLINNHLPKKGLRFFFSPENKHDISKRLEIGAKTTLPAPSHQIDRGIFENDVIKIAVNKGINFVGGTRIKDVEINKKGNHKLVYQSEKKQNHIECKWIVDSSGRGFFLKKKLKLQKDLDHNISSAWFRYKGVVDVNDWSNDKTWNTFLNPEDRKLATCHLMDIGYWVWIIPLVSGNTSIGIVADEKYHPLSTYNTYEKAMNWLKKNEVQAFEKFSEYDFELMDFKAVKHFPYDTKKYYSNQRWAVTGEASSFLDPFYSPGTDLIAINNSFIADLIGKDFANEDISMATMLYDITYNELIINWAPIYLNKYSLFGNTQIMIIKIMWDWTIYWSFPSLIFINKGYTNIDTLKHLFTQKDSLFPKVAAIGLNMQNFFLEWLEFDKVKRTDYIDFMDMSFIEELQKDLMKTFNQEELKQKVDDNLKMVEQLATYIFKRVTKEAFGIDVENIDPYTYTLNGGKDAILKHSSDTEKLEIPEYISSDMEKIWL